MRETDGRKLKHSVLEALRIRAVQQVEQGESPEVVIMALGIVTFHINLTKKTHNQLTVSK
jgi:hypothetical protein